MSQTGMEATSSHCYWNSVVVQPESQQRPYSA